MSLNPASPVVVLVRHGGPAGVPVRKLAEFEAIHLGRLRARHDAGECAGMECPACAYGRYLVSLEESVTTR